eukprot:5955878-Pleurochrysis_carterae.AAC.3
MSLGIAFLNIGNAQCRIDPAKFRGAAKSDQSLPTHSACDRDSKVGAIHQRPQEHPSPFGKPQGSPEQV